MSPRARWFLILAATLVSAGLTARLGVWQLDRAAQKIALQAAVDERAKLPVLDAAQLQPDLAAAQSQLQRRVLLRGRWLSEQTVFLDNRPMDGRVGFFVVTPFRLSGRSDAILVQRGWVPRDALDRSRLPTLPDDGTELEIQGRLAASPSRLYEFSAAHSGAIRQNLDAAEYAAEIHQVLLPLTVLQSAPNSKQDALLKRDWAAPELGLQKHYGYAFQWFALSALLLGLYVWFQIVRPFRQRRAERQPHHVR